MTRPTPCDFGRAFEELERAAEAAGYMRPSLMPVVEGWEAACYRADAHLVRRFHGRASVIHRDREQALLRLAEKLREEV